MDIAGARTLPEQGPWLDGTCAWWSWPASCSPVHVEARRPGCRCPETTAAATTRRAVYASQDLWVYIGRAVGAGLEYLIPVFSSEMTTSAISEAVPNGNLRESYFSMATNNLIEKHELYDFLPPDCVFESFIFFTDPLDTWDPEEPPPGGDLAPLTVHAFQRTFADFPFVHASNVSGDPNIRLAIYEEGSCERKPDNFRALDGKQYYFVFVNSSFDQAAHWQVGLQIN
jgi:hypothetical protein